MKNIFYTYKINLIYFVKITKTLKVHRVPRLETCTFWMSKSSAKTWEKKIKNKYPDAELIELTLNEVKAPKVRFDEYITGIFN